MNTVFDYLINFGDKTLKELPWNDVDNLICAIVSYFPLENFKEKRKMQYICWEASMMNVSKSNWYKEDRIRKATLIMVNAERYQDVLVSKFYSRVDDKTQFGAVTFDLGDIRVVAFKGSDANAIGWAENLRLSYQYPSYTQRLALKYLKEAIKEADSNQMLYVTGHSKGGNLAMSSVMELNDEEFDRIKGVCNLDGPGFLKEQHDSLKYKRMSEKLVNILPENSYIGCLMHNDGGKTIAVRTNSKGIDVHFPNRWEIFGPTLIDVGLDERAKYFNRVTAEGFDDLNREETKRFIEATFRELLRNPTTELSITGKEILAAINTAKNENVRLSAVFGKILLMIVAYSKIGDAIAKIIPSDLGEDKKKKKSE